MSLEPVFAYEALAVVAIAEREGKSTASVLHIDL
jgi:hypothetical protein